MTSSDQQRDGGRVDIRIDIAECVIRPEKHGAFSDALKGALSALSWTGADHLGGLLIVPDSRVEHWVNVLKDIPEPRPGRYRIPGDHPHAVTVPIEGEAGMVCVVVIGEGNLQAIDTLEGQGEVISTLLEELLHVRQEQTL